MATTKKPSKVSRRAIVDNTAEGKDGKRVERLKKRVSELIDARVKMAAQLEKLAADINRVDGAVAVLREELKEE